MVSPERGVHSLSTGFSSGGLAAGCSGGVWPEGGGGVSRIQANLAAGVEAGGGKWSNQRRLDRSDDNPHNQA